jgi:hypothetical protein
MLSVRPTQGQEMLSKTGDPRLDALDELRAAMAPIYEAKRAWTTTPQDKRAPEGASRRVDGCHVQVRMRVCGGDATDPGTDRTRGGQVGAILARTGPWNLGTG